MFSYVAHAGPLCTNVGLRYFGEVFVDMSRGFGKVSVDIYLLFGDCGYIMLKV